jgi:hypothetical protein
LDSNSEIFYFLSDVFWTLTLSNFISNSKIISKLASYIYFNILAKGGHIYRAFFYTGIHSLKLTAASMEE